MTTEEKIDRLTTIVDTLAATVVAHDNQIGAIATHTKTLGENLERLTNVVQKHDEELKAVVREWQTYLQRLQPQ
ncbi:MAG TPA: hypothetical protein VFW83_10145 [Bryobacteraceae bacterium]|nr:hypothetical protein [Bryobacteraceae bacterium]